MATVFKLNFITNGEGIKVIDEPTGYEGADFNIDQVDDGYGRNVSWAGGEAEFTFYRMREHEFELLLDYYKKYGWNAKVSFILEIDGIDNIIGDLDFYKANTDGLEYFKCKVIQDSEEATFSRREEINVDLFSDKDTFNEDITPLSTQRVLVKAKPVVRISKWETRNIYNGSITNSDQGSETRCFNPAVYLDKYDLEDSYVPFQIKDRNADVYRYLFLQNNLKNIEIKFSNNDITLRRTLNEGLFDADGRIEYDLIVGWGEPYYSGKFVRGFANEIIVFSGTINDNNPDDVILDYDLTANIDGLNRGESIYIYWKINAYKSSILGIVKFYFDVNSCDITITANSTTYNTVLDCVRVHDAVRQTVKSASKLDINFPFANSSGEMWNNMLFNGNMLRGLTDKPFYLNIKSINEWIYNELNGSYQIQTDKKVFYGLYKDFYTENEIGFLQDVVFDDYENPLNERYAINLFKYGWSKFLSTKEQDNENTYDIVHGESEWTVQNEMVENKLERKSKWIRDAFYLDSQIRKGIEVSESTATQDDDEVFIVDCIPNTTPLTFTEVADLSLVYNDEDNILTITNDGSFNFILLGLQVGDSFSINGSDPFGGDYTISTVNNRSIEVNRNNGNEDENGNRIVSFTYTITVDFINRTNEGFSSITGLLNPDEYANLVYTAKRNIKRFYESYLGTANMFADSEVLNTIYKNNGECQLIYEGVTTKEGDSIVTGNYILTPFVHKITAIMDFLEYKALELLLKDLRGFVRFLDSNQNVKRGYIKKMTYKNTGERGEVNMEIEEKNFDSSINIIYGNNGYLTIGNTYRTTKIIYEVYKDKIIIFDSTKERLYNPIFWYNITVNDAKATSLNELITWLDLLS